MSPNRFSNCPVKSFLPRSFQRSVGWKVCDVFSVVSSLFSQKKLADSGLDAPRRPGWCCSEGLTQRTACLERLLNCSGRERRRVSQCQVLMLRRLTCPFHCRPMWSTNGTLVSRQGNLLVCHQRGKCGWMDQTSGNRQKSLPMDLCFPLPLPRSARLAWSFTVYGFTDNRQFQHQT